MRNPFLSVGLIFFLSACGSAPTSVPMPDGGEPAAPTSEPGAPIPTTPPAALPGPYHRIYQGYARAKLKRPTFLKAINRNFLPLFPKAHPQGLTAYRPALPKSPRACSLPSEVALLTFASESDYAKYRESKIGKKIRDAHTPVFDPGASKSVVPEPLTDTIHFGHAYSINPGAHDYRKLHSALVVHCDPVASGEDLRLALVRSYAAGTEAIDVLFAVSKDHVVEYVFYANKADAAKRIAERTDRLRGVFRESAVVPLSKRKIKKTEKVAVGQGLDAQW